MYSASTQFDEYLQGEQSKYPKLTLDAIQTLKESLKDDCKLPLISDKMYIAFLHSCYFNVEHAKKTIKKYYSYHFDLPQVFCELDPLSDDIKQHIRCMSISQIIPSINLDKSPRVLYLQFKDSTPGLLDFVPYFKYLIMWIKYSLLIYGTCDGMIAVINNDGLSWRHIIKLPIGTTSKMIKFLELGLPFRLRSVHFLNAGSSTQMLMKIIARFANENLMRGVKVHAVGSEDIFNYIPRNLLPLEIGGTAKSHHYYNDEMYRHMVDNCEVFLEENTILKNQMNKNMNQ